MSVDERVLELARYFVRDCKDDLDGDEQSHVKGLSEEIQYSIESYLIAHEKEKGS